MDGVSVVSQLRLLMEVLIMEAAAPLYTLQHWTRGLLTLTSEGPVLAPGIATEYTILFIHSIHFIHCILHWSHLRQKQHRTVRTLHRGHHTLVPW